MLCDTRQHFGAGFVAIMEGENKIMPALARQRLPRMWVMPYVLHLFRLRGCKSDPVIAAPCGPSVKNLLGVRNHFRYYLFAIKHIT